MHAALSAEHRPHDYVIENVNVITMTTDEALKQSVFVIDGKVASISPTAVTNRAADMTAHDGTGRWLIPGLTDMHVHNLESHSQHLANIYYGVTTVRDLDGFPFLLKMRDVIAANELLAPRMLVSGTILNGSDFGGYAIALETPDEARAAVRAQGATGYDFIKTHNSLSQELFDAITVEANTLGIDVVGHIPVPVSVEHAVAAGMTTFEHFKGYIDDSTLTISDQDYVAATLGADVWNAPTFATYRNHLRGDNAMALLGNASEMQFVPPTARIKWNMHAQKEVDRVTELRQNIYPMSAQIFSELFEAGYDRFVAGTDSGSYEMLPPGVVLLEEVQQFQTLGMAPFDALETATVNAAAAMGRAGEFGEIRVGASADFVLLNANPLEDSANLSAIEAVGLRGVWLDAAAREDMAERLGAVYDRSEARLAAPMLTAKDLDDFVARLAALHDSGFVFRDHYLDLAASMYEKLEREGDAEKIMEMKTDRDFGFSWFRF